MFARTDRGPLATWWWTVDKPMLAAIIALMFGGLVLSLAGSPPVADKLGLDPFHFVLRHAVFLAAALCVLLATSLLDRRAIRRVAIGVFAVGIVLMVATLFAGFEIKGARRWLNLGAFALQPSEFVKPAFAVIIAWLFSEADRRPDMPAHIVAVGLVGLVVGLLVLQPDFGQTMLIVLVWGAVFFAAGMSWRWIVGLGGLGVGGIFAGAAFRLSDVAVGSVPVVVSWPATNRVTQVEIISCSLSLPASRSWVSAVITSSWGRRRRAAARSSM